MRCTAASLLAVADLWHPGTRADNVLVTVYNGQVRFPLRNFQQTLTIFLY